MEYQEAEELILEGLKKNFPGHDILFTPMMKEQRMGEPEKELKRIIIDNQMTRVCLFKEFVLELLTYESIEPIPEIVALLTDEIKNNVKFN
jgi:hypothetical protein